MELFVLWVICGVVTAIIASSKGRSGFGWFFIGLLLSIFGIILIACLPSLKAPATHYSSQPIAHGRADKDCPDCGETVLYVANVCKHCGFRFDGKAVSGQK